MNWNPELLPDLRGQVHAITGATGGIGYFAAEQLAAGGAEVVLVSRSAERMRRAREAIRAQVLDAQVRAVTLELTSLTSVAEATAALRDLPRLDGLFLNGGPMHFSARDQTQDGLPLMLGAHTVANVALIAGLMPRLADQNLGRPMRIVHASTGFVRRFPVSPAAFDKAPRTGIGAYIRAKTATEVFAHELDRRLRAADLPVLSLLSRPGVGVDAKTPSRPGLRNPRDHGRRNPFTPWAQGKDAAAWPGVRALVDPDAHGGDYYAPAAAMRGAPVRVPADPRTQSPGAGIAERVWDRLVDLGGAGSPV